MEVKDTAQGCTLCPETIKKSNMEALQDLSMECQKESLLDLAVGSSHPETHSRFDRREIDINNKCTTVCGDSFSRRSCAKTVLVNVYHKSDPNELTLYAIVDDQSNCTLAKSELFDYIRIPKSTTQQFKLSSCAGRQQISGRRALG